MTAPLQTTFEVLSKSRNDSAVSVLVSALEANDEAIFNRTLKALISRRNRSGHFAVVSRWHLLSPEQRELVREGRGKITAGLRDGILSEDEQTFTNACDIAEEFREFDLISTLVTLSEDRTRKESSQATALVVKLVNLLSEMVHGRRDKKDRRDPNMIRRHVLESLERSVERFRKHTRTELIEAFVVLGGSSSGLLRAIIDDPRHACYLTVAHTLSTSESTAVVQLLLNFLESEHASQASLTIISKRADLVFLYQLLQFVGDQPKGKVKKNLSRIRNFAWLKAKEWSIGKLDETEQRCYAALVLASGLNKVQLLELLEQLLKKGQPGGRAAACESLATMQGERPGRLILEALNDPAPQVQAAATRQLRERRIAGAMGLLVKLVDSPHELVRDAARESLSEFSLKNYLNQFDTLDDDSRQSKGELTAKVDKNFVRQLTGELESRSRKNRMRAIEIAEVTGMVRPLADALVERLEDEDHLVRVAAAEVLQYCPTAEVQEALRHATHDRSPAVQNTAKSTLAGFADLHQPLGATAATEGRI